MKLNDNMKLLLSAIALFLIIIFAYQKNQTNLNFKPYETKLISNDKEIKLSDFKGKIILMYFGFLTCPEACPTTLNKFAGVFKELTPEELNNVEMIFVDLDPERDTLQKMKDYTSFFHPKIIPVQINPKDFAAFNRFFGIEFRKVQLNSNMGYTIDHSTDVVVVSPDQKMLPNFHHESEKKFILQDLKKLLNEYYKK